MDRHRIIEVAIVLMKSLRNILKDVDVMVSQPRHAILEIFFQNEMAVLVNVYCFVGMMQHDLDVTRTVKKSGHFAV